MTELPIVVNMTVDASPTDYDLKAETNQQALSLSNDIVIDTSGQALPLYEGPYTVNAGLAAVTLDTDGKRMTQDVTVNALTDNSVSMTDFTVAANSGIAAITSTVTRGYSPTAKSTTTTVQLPTQARATITPSTSEQIAVAKGKYTTGVVKVAALTENTLSDISLAVNSSNGEVTASVSLSAGYNEVGKGKIETLALSTQSARTVTPTTSEQTAVARGKYTTGAVKVRAIPTGTAGTPTATKGTVSNHSVSVTPSVTNTTGYIEGGTINGTAVSVSASELVSGSLSITTNNTYDVTNYASAVVNVSGGVTPTGTINISTNGTYDVTNYRSAVVSVSGVATGTFTPTENTGSVTINTGLSSVSGYLIIPNANPYINNNITIYAALADTTSTFAKAMCVRGKGTTNRGFELWISSTPPHTITGGTIALSYVYPDTTGYFTPVTYKWFAW